MKAADPAQNPPSPASAADASRTGRPADTPPRPDYGCCGPVPSRPLRWNAWWCIENLWKVENPKSISPLGIEREVTGNLKSAPVRGFIDRYETSDDGLIRISDYKTGKTPAKSWVADK